LKHFAQNLKDVILTDIISLLLILLWLTKHVNTLCFDNTRKILLLLPRDAL